MQLSPSNMKWSVIALVAAWLTWLLAPVLTPFLMGGVLAYALQPCVEALAIRHVPRWLAALLVETAFIAILLGVGLLLVPIVSEQIPMLRAQVPGLIDQLGQSAARWAAQLGLPPDAADLGNLKSLLMRLLGATGNGSDWLSAATQSARIGGSFVLTAIGNLVLIPVVSFYALLDWPSLVARWRALVPAARRPAVDDFVRELDAVMGQYLRGQLAVMALLAVYYSAALGIAGFSLALPLGVFTGLVIFVPYVGFGIGLALALLSGALQFSGAHGLLAAALVYGGGQVLEGFFLTPRLVGQRIGLSPLAVLFALLAFGHVFGLFGVLLALPASAVVAVVLRRWLRSTEAPAQPK